MMMMMTILIRTTTSHTTRFRFIRHVTTFLGHILLLLLLFGGNTILIVLTMTIYTNTTTWEINRCFHGAGTGLIFLFCLGLVWVGLGG